MLYQSPDGGCDNLTIMGLLFGAWLVTTQLFGSFGDRSSRNREAFFLEPVLDGRIVVTGDWQFWIFHQLLLPQEFLGHCGFDFSQEPGRRLAFIG